MTEIDKAHGLVGDMLSGQHEQERRLLMLERQNGALRTLRACLEDEIKVHRAKAQEYYLAITSLDSEREANALLTAEVEGLTKALQKIAENDSDGLHMHTPQAMQSIARNAVALFAPSRLNGDTA